MVVRTFIKNIKNENFSKILNKTNNNLKKLSLSNRKEIYMTHNKHSKVSSNKQTYHNALKTFQQTFTIYFKFTARKTLTQFPSIIFCLTALFKSFL